jgi:hypothetical protein
LDLKKLHAFWKDEPPLRGFLPPWLVVYVQDLGPKTFLAWLGVHSVFVTYNYLPVQRCTDGPVVFTSTTSVRVQPFQGKPFEVNFKSDAATHVLKSFFPCSSCRADDVFAVTAPLTSHKVWTDTPYELAPQFVDRFVPAYKQHRYEYSSLAPRFGLGVHPKAVEYERALVQQLGSSDLAAPVVRSFRASQFEWWARTLAAAGCTVEWWTGDGPAQPLNSLYTTLLLHLLENDRPELAAFMRDHVADLSLLDTSTLVRASDDVLVRTAQAFQQFDRLATATEKKAYVAQQLARRGEDDFYEYLDLPRTWCRPSKRQDD